MVDSLALDNYKDSISGVLSLVKSDSLIHIIIHIILLYLQYYLFYQGISFLRGLTDGLTGYLKI